MKLKSSDISDSPWNIKTLSTELSVLPLKINDKVLVKVVIPCITKLKSSEESPIP